MPKPAEASASDDSMLDVPSDNERVTVGDNSDKSGPVAADELRLLIERIERLEAEKKALADDIKDVYGEAKARGYHAPTMRRIVALRRMEAESRKEADALLETYRAAVGLD